MQLPASLFLTWVLLLGVMGAATRWLLLRPMAASGFVSTGRYVGLVLISLAASLGPAVVEALSFDPEVDNVGWPFIFTGLIYFGIPLFIVSAIVGGLVARSSSREAGLTSAILVFVPAMAIMLWFSVGMGMTG